MIEFLKFLFSSIWNFLGILIMLSIFIKLIKDMWCIFWRHRTLTKHGYPPSHCDVDGLSLPKTEENE